MKKITLILIAIFILIASGGFFYSYIYFHSKESLVKDSDGKDIYQKGFISKRTLLGYEVIEGDVCVNKSSNEWGVERGNAVLEKFLWDENSDIEISGRALFTYNLVECPNGCENGACLK
ncbi:MAG: hypothetical protein AAB925_02315 [Patescibacteria group bacterium]